MLIFLRYLALNALNEDAMTRGEFEQIVVNALCEMVGTNRIKNSIMLSDPADQVFVEMAVDHIVADIAGEIGVVVPPRSPHGMNGRGGDYTISHVRPQRFYPRASQICTCIQETVNDAGMSVKTNWMGAELTWQESGKLAAEINITSNEYEILLTFWYKDAEGLDE